MAARTIVVSILTGETTSIVNGVRAAQEKLAAYAHALLIMPQPQRGKIAAK
jgi:hypothetical protein